MQHGRRARCPGQDAGEGPACLGGGGRGAPTAIVRTTFTCHAQCVQTSGKLLLTKAPIELVVLPDTIRYLERQSRVQRAAGVAMAAVWVEPDGC